MVEPLRKLREDGTPYQRRPAVERELQELEALDLSGIVAVARAGEQQGKPAVSSEALVYVLRREVHLARTDGPTLGSIDALAAILVRRCERILKRRLWQYDDLAHEEITEDVTKRVVDDIYENGDLADYAEVNFNHWLSRNRSDACRKYSKKLVRVERPGDLAEALSENEAYDISENGGAEASSEHTPETLYALSEAREKAKLPPLIESANLPPEVLYRIGDMVNKAMLPPNVLNAFLAYHYLEMQIESEDPDKHTLVKHFNKSEKMIRLWIKRAEKAFAKLRETKNESDPNEADEPGIGAAQLSR